MSLIKQLVLVAALGGLGVAAYQYGWPLVAPAAGDRTAQGRRDGARAVTVVVNSVELQTERTRIKAVGTARAYPLRDAASVPDPRLGTGARRSPADTAPQGGQSG